jgi:hypothetical protein
VRREVEHGVFLLGVSREVIQGGIYCEYSGRPVCVLRSCGTQGEGIGERETTQQQMLLALVPGGKILCCIHRS